MSLSRWHRRDPSSESPPPAVDSLRVDDDRLYRFTSKLLKSEGGENLVV
jgi:hypothetical protein